MGNMQKLLGSIKKEFSKDNPDIVYDPNKIVNFISSGNFMFDLVSGGGFPRKRLSEVFGMEHSGKSSILYAAFAKIQKDGGVGVLFDFEGTFDPVFAKDVFGLEIDNETFTLFSPDDLEEWDKIFDVLAGVKRRYGKVSFTGEGIDKIDLMGFDSIEAMKPRALINCSLSDERRIGAQAQAVGRVIAKLKAFAKRTNCAIVLTNQMRAIINTSKVEQGTGTGAGFNVMESHNTPGGYAPRFYSSLRIKLEYGGQIKDEMGLNLIDGVAGKTRIGHLIKVINVKNKVFTPFLKGKTHFFFSTPFVVGGWSEEQDVLSLLKSRGFVRQVGTKLSFVFEDYSWSSVKSKIKNEEAFFAEKKNMELGVGLIKKSMCRINNEENTILEKVSLQELDIIEKEELGTLKLKDLLENDEEETEPVEEIKI